MIVVLGPRRCGKSKFIESLVEVGVVELDDPDDFEPPAEGVIQLYSFYVEEYTREIVQRWVERSGNNQIEVKIITDTV